MTSNFEILTQINLNDLIASFGWQNRPVLARLLRKVFYKPARTFAEFIVEFDIAVGERGLVEASRLTQRHFVRDVRVFGLDLSTRFASGLPDSAFLALSNHPGMSDTLALFCALNRPDLKIIALDRPFLNSLPNTSKHLFYLKDDVASRVSFVRQVTSHLRNGGAALTFPAGHIEPDPDVHEGALDSLQTWTDSAGVFIRMAPETAVLPVLVRSVVWDKAARHFLLGIKKTKEEREKLAATFQLLAHVAFKKKDVHVRVQIGKPIYAKDLGTTETAVIHQAVLVEIKRLIENPSQGEGMSVMQESDSHLKGDCHF
ncbi:MAG: glycerol acyltransferase [Chloroflexi bacterium]|nr:glycerol acyltransferase [Chloroflexota bacterium]